MPQFSNRETLTIRKLLMFFSLTSDPRAIIIRIGLRDVLGRRNGSGASWSPPFLDWGMSLVGGMAPGFLEPFVFKKRFSTLVHPPIPFRWRFWEFCQLCKNHQYFLLTLGHRMTIIKSGSGFSQSAEWFWGLPGAIRFKGRLSTSLYLQIQHNLIEEIPEPTFRR